MSLAWPAVVQLVVSLTLARRGCMISHQDSSLLHHNDPFDICVFAVVHRLS